LKTKQLFRPTVMALMLAAAWDASAADRIDLEKMHQHCPQHPAHRWQLAALSRRIRHWVWHPANCRHCAASLMLTAKLLPVISNCIRAYLSGAKPSLNTVCAVSQHRS
jgi:hypothetical protein